MNNRRRVRLYTVLAIVSALALAVGLVMYALRANIDLFYTPGEIRFGKGDNAIRPQLGQHLRIGGYVLPGSVQRDAQSLAVHFVIYDARGEVAVAYQGILPDLFREGQGVVAQGVLDAENHIQANQILAKHDENYTPPEVAAAMQPTTTSPSQPSASKGGH
jgi:cytochrome c-type biogenesis protein CcmE